MFLNTFDVHWRLQKNYHSLTCIWLILLSTLCTHSMSQPVCSYPVPLGMADGSIADIQITATSYYQMKYLPSDGRLYNERYWRTNVSDPSSPWIQVDFLSGVIMIGIKTQGSSRPYYDWVESLEIQTGNSTNSLTYIKNDIETHMEFDANSDRDSVKDITFPYPIHARYLRIRPKEWHVWCALRFEVIGCPLVNECTDLENPCNTDARCYDLDSGYNCACSSGGVTSGIQCDVCLNNGQLGVADPSTVSDGQITASSSFTSGGYQSYPWFGRLFGLNSWIAENNDKAPWIQVDFLYNFVMKGILTQGSSFPESSSRVTMLKILTGISIELLDYIMDGASNIFPANSDRTIVASIMFPTPTIARYLRIEPTENNGRYTLRFDVIGCRVFDNCSSCHVDATCIAVVGNRYQCICKEGYVGDGTQCQDINECASSPCANGDCRDSLNVYNCVCHTGWTGINCDENIDDCEISPCIYGKCVDDVNGYICMCDSGWTGMNCDSDKEIDSAEQLSGNNSTGAIAGGAGGGILVLIILVVIVVYLVLRRRTQNTTPDNPKLEFNGPYDVTIPGTDQPPTTNDSTTHNNQAFVSDPDVNQSNADVYQTVPSADEYSYAYADSGAPPKPEDATVDTIYTYADTPSGVRPTLPQQSASSHEGWKDNSIYDKSNDDHDGSNNQSKQIISEDTDEGWEDNSVYATSGGDHPPGDGRVQLPGTDVEGWAENDIYND